jgi:hypothetical protein
VSGFIRLGETLVPLSRVAEIDASRLASEGQVTVKLEGETRSVGVSGGQAVDLVMRVDPSFFEGRRFHFVRSSWAFHNLVAHPLLQLLAWAGHTRAGLALHDATIPQPRARSRSGSL